MGGDDGFGVIKLLKKKVIEIFGDRDSNGARRARGDYLPDLPAFSTTLRAK
jgi:hypothetical protein